MTMMPLLQEGRREGGGKKEGREHTENREETNEWKTTF